MSETETPDAPPVGTPDAPPVEPPVPGEDALGDAGKQALDRMKAERNAAREAAAAATAEKEALKAQLAEATAKGETFDLEKAIEERTAAIATQYQQKVAAAEIRAAAAGHVRDDAVDLMVALPEFNPTNFLTDSGEVDQGKVAAAISDLISTKPYLAAQGPVVKGSGDGGPRNASRPQQLTKTDLERMTANGQHHEITKAKAEGRFDDLLGIKR